MWQDLEQVARLQGRLTEQDLVTLKLTPVILSGTTVLATESGRIYVPDDENLRVRLCVIAHAGLQHFR